MRLPALGVLPPRRARIAAGAGDVGRRDARLPRGCEAAPARPGAQGSGIPEADPGRRSGDPPRHSQRAHTTLHPPPTLSEPGRGAPGQRGCPGAAKPLLALRRTLLPPSFPRAPAALAVWKVPVLVEAESDLLPPAPPSTPRNDWQVPAPVGKRRSSCRLPAGTGLPGVRFPGAPVCAAGFGFVHAQELVNTIFWKFCWELTI